MDHPSPEDWANCARPTKCATCNQRALAAMCHEVDYCICCYAAGHMCFVNLHTCRRNSSSLVLSPRSDRQWQQPANRRSASHHFLDGLPPRTRRMLMLLEILHHRGVVYNVGELLNQHDGAEQTEEDSHEKDSHAIKNMAIT